MNVIIGVVIGIAINYLIIKPIKQKHIRKELIEKGIISEDMVN